MEITAGTILANYEVISPLGAGGMAEVFLAEDKRLGRKVALKLLPAAFTADQDRLRRFEQEARSASALNHPNIITIYEIGQIEETHFIATEYIAGVTLRRQLAQQRLPLLGVVNISIQTAEALAAAHAAHIVHRDIKPENIMVRPDGYVKVLDFGLAKLTEPPVETALPSESPINIDDDPANSEQLNQIDQNRSQLAELPTVFGIETQPGIVIGSPNYMSPEQATGMRLDPRTDIFSLGSVIFEMVTGVMAFRGPTSSHILVAILDHEVPPLDLHRPEVPAELNRIVSKALRKDRRQRYQTIGDLLVDLKNLKQEMEFEAKLARSAAGKPVKEKPVPTGSQPVIVHTIERPSEIVIKTVHASGKDSILRRLRQHKISTGLALTITAVVVLIAVGLFYFGRSSNNGAVNSLAVLPFVNEGGDPSADYLSDGITESLINNLSQLSNLTVMSRSSVFRYKGQQMDPATIGRELKVQAVLLGRLIQRGDILSIRTELVDTRTNRQLWGEQYNNRKMADILTLQEDISHEISERLRVRLSGEDRSKINKRYTENTEAYRLYLKGRYYWNKRTPEWVNQGIQYFNQAIEIDPNYALAYVGLADSYNVLGDLGVLAPRECYPRAKASAQKALEVDPQVAEAYAALALARMFYDWDFPQAETEFKRALELNPGYAAAHQWYAIYLESQARHGEAQSELKRAQELDPLSLNINSLFGYSLYLARQYDPAAAQLQKTIEMDPSFFRAHFCLGLVYDKKGMTQAAIAELQKAVTVSDRAPLALSWLGYSYALAGKQAEARQILDELTTQAQQRFVPSYFFAVVYVALGDHDKAFALLEQAFQEQSGLLVYMNVEPAFDSLRADPRFVNLVSRINRRTPPSS